MRGWRNCSLGCEMKNWLIFGAVIFGIFAYSDYAKQQKIEARAAKEAACQANPACRTKKANDEARYQSLLSKEPKRSTSGAIYFKGYKCSADCAGHIAGYEWAEERGISKEEGCYGRSDSFNEGCLLYVSERVSELEESGREAGRDSEERESCTPGRYGDC